MQGETTGRGRDRVLVLHTTASWTLEDHVSPSSLCILRISMSTCTGNEHVRTYLIAR